MVQIRFKAQGSNSLIGGFNHGDFARVGEAFAKHLVEEAKVAEYVDAAPKKAEPAPERRTKPKAGK